MKKCIDEMKTFVSGNPTWYIDAKGDDAATLDLPPALWTNEIDIDVSKPISNPTMTTAEGSKDIVELENCERFDVEDMDGSEQVYYGSNCHSKKILPQFHLVNENNSSSRVNNHDENK